MAITSIDGMIAGAVAPRPYFKVGATMEAAGVMWTSFYSSGMPGAAAAPAPGLAGAALTSYAGQLPFTNPVSGETRVASMSISSNIVCRHFLLDRLWHNSGVVVTTTTSQTINSAAWPARDANGSTNGLGVMVGIEVRTATTNASAVTNTTMSYTNQDGTSGKTATISSFPATAVAGTFVPFQLAAGDTGVRSIQSITLGTSYGAGAIHLVAYRILATSDTPAAYVSDLTGMLEIGCVKMYDNTVPYLVHLPSATTAMTSHGTVSWAQG